MGVEGNPQVLAWLLAEVGGPGWRVCSLLLSSPYPSSELCCRACVGFYHWVMVAVTGGVGVAATLSLCSLFIWPLRLRSCEL